ncbi:TetR/AcrR family transcriptional regulator [Azospirillum picis]|uniref:AcrR family transcriptional regulator n=1 Tax=Azospirillum picis TaxID=488438 RepID=A0ABU0MJ84_9PROT|nr:TetR/AcrR family transcriptional regulator [Azospirillum picis]MBP2299729.1 AcrR family transcriptional regulator [Azospirillum picis]MDQ0533525.1 AcrR family transcriptional regulator [Azospirillum picis]
MITGSHHKDPPACGPRGLARRQAILAAARRLFIEKGFEKTTLSDIIGEAGGSRATLYEQFGDKDGLFRAIMEEDNAMILSGLAPARADDRVTPEAGLTAFALHLVKALLNDETTGTVRILIAEGDRVPDIAESFFRIGPENAIRRLADYLQHLSDAGELHVENPAATAQAFLGMVTGNLLIRRLILPESAPAIPDLDRYVRQAVRLFLNGARTGGARTGGARTSGAGAAGTATDRRGPVGNG